MTNRYERHASFFKSLEMGKHRVKSIDDPMASVPIREEVLGKLFDFEKLVFFLSTQDRRLTTGKNRNNAVDEWSWRRHLFDIMEVNFEDINSFAKPDILVAIS